MPFPHSRIHISNLTRLLDLPEPVREHVAYGRLSMGQARALIGARDPERLAREVIDRDLSVRETEKLAREVKAGGAGANAASRDRGEPNADIAALERQLGDLIGLQDRKSTRLNSSH